MATVMIIAAIVGIVATVLGTGANIYQLGVQHMSSKVRGIVSNLASEVGKALSSGRLKVNKLLSLLQSKNTNALMTYLDNNPIISKRLDELQANSDLVAELQAKQTSIEGDIAQLYNELNSLGYTNSISGANRDEKKAKDLKNQIDAKQQEYNALGDHIKATNVSTVQKATTYTGDLDARSQNIKGGLV